MAQKKWLIILGIVNLLAIAGIVFWYINRDNTAPVITQEMEIVYEETMSDSELLQGAVAIDETDGDVSHTLVVEKITVNHNTGIAMVTYGAMDESGNIAKQSFRMAIEEASMEASLGDRANEVFTLTAGEAANGNEENAGADGDIEAEVSEGSDDALSEDAESDEEADSEDDENTDDEASDAEGNADDEDTDAEEDADGEADSEDEEANQEAERARAEAQRAQARNNQQSEEIPVLNFGAAEVKTKKGYNPAWVSVISQLQDNKDSYEYLLQHLQIAGEYTNSAAGTYDVSVTTVDSDGNTSAARAIRIIVEE